MTDVFGPEYAGLYDLLYADKDYAAECDLLDQLFDRFGSGPVDSVLDLGCGTGNHAIRLAERGYHVVGVDRSPGMLQRAREKASRAATRTVSFTCSDLQNFALAERFDAVLMMFAVLSYQLDDSDVLAAFANARRHLHDAGLLIFDVWYGPAVLRIQPSERVKTVAVPAGEIQRMASGRFRTSAAVCDIEFRTTQHRANTAAESTVERHAMRFFFPAEIRSLLAEAGFDLLSMTGFPEVEQVPDESTWSVLVVARARPR